MEKISCATHISRFEVDRAPEHIDVENEIKRKMAYDIANEILKKIPIIEEPTVYGDRKYVLSFYVTTSEREVKIISELTKALEILMK